MFFVITIRAFIVPKVSEEYADIQDSFGLLGLQRRRICIADGISQSLFPRQWADILVRSYCDGSFSLKNEEGFSAPATSWSEEAQSIIRKKQERGDKNTWVFENQLASGRSAGATFVGLELSEDLSSWDAEIIGDSCLAVVSSEGVITTMHASKNLDEAAFDNYPDYLDSRPGKLLAGKPGFPTGQIVPGQKILLVTDALADMLNERRKAGENVLDLLAVQNHQQFVGFVEEHRRLGLLKNDDTTAIMLNVISDAAADVPELRVLAQTDEQAEQAAMQQSASPKGQSAEPAVELPTT